MAIAIGQKCFLAFVFLFLHIFHTISQSNDTISVNKSLSGDNTLVSSRGNFELGFFKPGNSSKYYIGMWYKKVSLQTIAWVANRETPVSDKYSSELKILEGNLVLFNEFKIPIWSTNINSSTTSNSTLAILQDDGNLVLKNELHSDFPVWESFDYPTHTLLPGAKIAYNKLTKTKQSITSWKNNEDPAPGPFSLVPEPNGTQYFLMWNMIEQYWNSGPWNGQIFSSMQEMRVDYNYNFTFINNEKENYFTYSAYDTSIISRLIIDVTGQLTRLTWLESTQEWHSFGAQPRTQCEVYFRCGFLATCRNSLPYCSCFDGFKPGPESDWNLDGHSGGCVRKRNFQCGNSSNNIPIQERDGFLKLQMRLPDNPTPSLTIRNATPQICKSICLGNCSCTAYAYENDRCLIWNEELLNLQEDGGNNGREIYIKVAFSDLPKILKKRIKGIVIHVIVSLVVVIVVVFFIFLMIVGVRRKRRMVVGEINIMGDSLVPFGYKDLQIATKNFSEKLGSGGFGSVFKGTLRDQTIIAVKKLETINQGEKQFRTEVSTIGTLQHVNLVRLRGFCSQGSNKLLVYDYLQNGSLEAHLFRDNKVLNWKTRYQIALGIARGLAYLHEKCRDCIIHCDIKPENILLDEKYCPKIADFGLAKLFGRDFSRVLTTIRGTRGYLAPEWISGVAITAKADVYSYGMMLLEFVSGRRNSNVLDSGKFRYFPSWAASVAVDDEDIHVLLDARLDGVGDEDEVRRICRVACWCIQDDENIRPSMSKVVQILEMVSDVNKPPFPRSLNMFVDNLQEPIVFFTELSEN